MPDHRRARCKVCGRTTDEVGELSWSGKCVDDGSAALRSNIDQMMARSGPNFVRWRQAMAASVGGVLLDDANAKP